MNHNFEQSFGNSENKGFERSSNKLLEGQSLSVNLQHHLKLLQSMSLLKVELSCQSIADVFRVKAGSKLNEGFRSIKKANLNKDLLKTISHKDLETILNLALLFQQKVTTAMQSKMRKNIMNAFFYLKMASLPVFGTTSQTLAHHNDKSNSVTSPYQITSKISNSERVESEWDLGNSQGVEWTENTNRQNRFLKKKKQKIKDNQSKFISKMNQLLSEHETFLAKK